MIILLHVRGSATGHVDQVFTWPLGWSVRILYSHFFNIKISLAKTLTWGKVGHIPVLREATYIAWRMPSNHCILIKSRGPMSFKKNDIPDLPAEPHQPFSFKFPKCCFGQKKPMYCSFKASGLLTGHFFTMLMNLKMFFVILVSLHLSLIKSSPATIQLQLL